MSVTGVFYGCNDCNFWVLMGRKGTFNGSLGRYRDKGNFVQVTSSIN